MLYRRAETKDAKQVAELLVKCFNIKSIDEGKEAFLRERKKDIFVVAEKNGKLIGLISWDMHGLPKHQLGRIERMCAIAGPERDKVAEGLITAAIQDADKFFKKMNLKLRKLYTMVHSTNIKMRNFYKRMGFEEEAKLRDHYYKGKDEYILSMFFE